MDELGEMFKLLQRSLPISTKDNMTKIEILTFARRYIEGMSSAVKYMVETGQVVLPKDDHAFLFHATESDVPQTSGQVNAYSMYTRGGEFDRDTLQLQGFVVQPSIQDDSVGSSDNLAATGGGVNVFAQNWHVHQQEKAVQIQRERQHQFQRQIGTHGSSCNAKVARRKRKSDHEHINAATLTLHDS